MNPLHQNGSRVDNRKILVCEFGSTGKGASARIDGKAKRRDSFWAATPFLSVVTVLTPATTWTEGFTNRLIGTDYSENLLPWQMV